MSEHNTNTEGSAEKYKQLVGHVGAHLQSEETRRFLFISVNDDDVPFSCSFPGESVSGEAIQSEAEMLAEYILTISNREDEDAKTVMKRIISEMNNGGVGSDNE